MCIRDRYQRRVHGENILWMRSVVVLVAILLGVVSALQVEKKPRGPSPFRNFNWTRTAEILRQQGRIAKKAVNLIEAIQTISRDPFDEEFPGKKRRLGDPWPTFPRIPRPYFLSEFVNKQPLSKGKYSRTSPTNPRPPKKLLGLEEVEESVLRRPDPTRIPDPFGRDLPRRIGQPGPTFPRLPPRRFDY
eukprot:TRINITY_DN3471_c0_g1_i3.p1 TRINITY_DN3471_c0_g1~~TRINITY_DN3471_c0_g1_i3.p1  ORF type:complete len:209 (+),score=76.36 TRINITY_DN3471_c0_g1_i3:62-628(+)